MLELMLTVTVCLALVSQSQDKFAVRQKFDELFAASELPGEHGRWTRF